MIYQKEIALLYRHEDFFSFKPCTALRFRPPGDQAAVVEDTWPANSCTVKDLSQYPTNPSKRCAGNHGEKIA